MTVHFLTIEHMEDDGLYALGLVRDLPLPPVTGKTSQEILDHLPSVFSDALEGSDMRVTRDSIFVVQTPKGECVEFSFQ